MENDLTPEEFGYLDDWFEDSIKDKESYVGKWKALWLRNLFEKLTGEKFVAIWEDDEHNN